MTSGGRWVTRIPGERACRLRLFCFPYAGAGSNVYGAWRPHLPPDVELALVHLPGREARFSEPPHVRIDALLDELLPALRPHLDAPFTFYGHSMGALIAFESARRLQREDAPQPQRLLVSGHRAPHLPYPRAPVHMMGDDAIDREFQRLGGTPPEILADPGFMRLLRPILRADLTLCETYRHEPGPPLGCGMTAFAGADDGDAPPAAVAPWRTHTDGPYRFHVLPGRHFFIHAHRDMFLEKLNGELMGVVQ